MITASNGERITVKVVGIKKGCLVRLGFEADEAVIIHRREIQDRVDREQRKAR